MENGDPAAGLGFGGLASTPDKVQDWTVPFRERATLLTKQAMASGEVDQRDPEAIKSYAKTVYKSLIRRQMAEPLADVRAERESAQQALVDARVRRITQGVKPAGEQFQAVVTGSGPVQEGLRAAGQPLAPHAQSDRLADLSRQEANLQAIREQYRPRVPATDALVQQKLQEQLRQVPTHERAIVRGSQAFGEAMGVPLEAQLAAGSALRPDIARTSEQNRAMADQLRQANTEVGGFPETLGESVGTAAGMLTGLKALEAIPLSLMRNQGYLGGMGRMATYSAAQPELTEALGGPEAQGTVAGRAAEGALLDLLLRGSNRVMAPATPAMTRAGQVVDQAGLGAATGGILAAAHGVPDEKRALADMAAFGLVGAAGQNPFARRTKLPTPKAEDTVAPERVPSKTPAVELTEARPELLKDLTIPEEYLGERLVPKEEVAGPVEPMAKPEVARDLKTGEMVPIEQKAEAAAPPVGEQLSPERPARKAERWTERLSREAAEGDPNAALDLAMRLERKGQTAAAKRVLEFASEIERASVERKSRGLSVSEDPTRPNRALIQFRSRDGKQVKASVPWDAARIEQALPTEMRPGVRATLGRADTPSTIEFHAGIPVPRTIRNLARDLLIDTGRAERRLSVWRGHADRWLGRHLDKPVFQKYRRMAGIPSPRPVMKDLRKIQTRWDERIFQQYQRAATGLRMLTKEQQQQFWRDLETYQTLPDNHPMKKVNLGDGRVFYPEQEFDRLVTEVGDAQFRAGNIPKETLKEMRRPGVQRYVKHLAFPPRGKHGIAKKYAELKRRIVAQMNEQGRKTGNYADITTEAGVGGLAKATEPTIKSAVARRRRLTLEQMESDRILLKDGRMLFGLVTNVGDKSIRLERAGTAVEIPVEQITRIEEPYVTGAAPILKTILDQGQIGKDLESMEFIRDKHPDLWREAPKHGTPEAKDRDWVTLPNEPQWGVLKGKQLSREVYDELMFFRKPASSGIGDFLITYNNLLKQGMTLGRIPGYITKTVPENLLNAMALGLSFERFWDRNWKAGNEILDFIRHGKESDAISRLLAKDSLFGGGHLFELTEGATQGPPAGPFSGIQARGLEYLRQYATHHRDNLDLLMRNLRESHPEGHGIFRAVAAYMRAVSEAGWGFDPAKAAGVKTGRVAVSGEGIQAIAAFVDASARLAVYHHLTETGPMGSLRMGLRRGLEAVGAVKKKPTGISPDRAIEMIRRVYDPRTLSPAINAVSRFTFLRMPLMMTREMLMGRALTQPHAAAMLFGTAWTLKKLAYSLMSLDDDQRKEADAALEAAGKYSRGGSANLVPLGKDEQGNWRILDIGALTLRTMWNEAVPGENVVRKAGEPGVIRSLRGAASNIPAISQLLRIANYDPTTGERAYQNSFLGGATEAMIPALPGAMTASQWMRGTTKQAQQEARGQQPTSDLDARMFRLLTGLKQTKIPTPGTPEFAPFERLIQLNEMREKQMDAGMDFKTVSKFPVRPAEGAPAEEWDSYREKLRLYYQEHGLPGFLR